MNTTEIVVRCLHCGTKNRIPWDRVQARPVCGRCGLPLDEIIMPCLACGAKNRLPENRLGQRPRCGRCGTPLIGAGEAEAVTAVTDVSFRREVMEASGVNVVECWAAWCMPCRQIAPVVEELARQYAGTARFLTLNVEQNPLTAAQFDIRSIPTLLIFRDGRLVDRIIGMYPKPLIEERIWAAMEANG